MQMFTETQSFFLVLVSRSARLNLDLSLSSSLTGDLQNSRLLRTDMASRTLPFRVKLEARAENLEGLLFLV